MNAAAIPVKGLDKAKKKPPKLIEKVIDKVEEVLTSPAHPEPVSAGKIKPKKQVQPIPAPKSIPPQQHHVIPDPEQAQMQGSLGGNSEYVLPEGTTIKLPDGNEFETHTKSKISKVSRQQAGKKGGEV